MTSKDSVRDFWERASCGESLYLSSPDQVGYLNQAKQRYRLEGSMIFPFAKFSESKGLNVLEVGVGLGADHQQFAQAGSFLSGIDLTERAVAHTFKILQAFGLTSNLAVADAESLKFENQSYDVVYSWGVLHHSPNIRTAISEVYRVLKWGGAARIMIYHKWSVIGLMLWLRYGLLAFCPFRSLDDIYSKHLESPGTKAFSKKDACEMFADFSYVSISTPLGHGDLLESDVGQRHRGFMLTLARLFWPRWLLRTFFPNNGLAMLITAY